MVQAANRVAKNSIFVFGARVSEFASGVLIVILTARYLGVKSFGEYALIRTVGIVLSPLMTWGSLQILIRDISVERQQAAALVNTGLTLNALMTVVALAIAALVAFALQLTSKVFIFALYLTVFSQALMVMTKTVNSVFIAYERMAYNSLIIVFTRLLAVLLIAVAVYFDLGFLWIFVALVIANAMGLFSAFFVLSYKFIKPGSGVKFQQLIYLVKEASAIAISNFLNQGYTNINVFLLKIFQSVTQVSFFQAAHRIITPLLLLPRSFLLAFVPTLSRLAATDSTKPNLEYAYEKTLKYIFIISIPFAMWGTICAPKVILWLFAEDFLAAAEAFQILIWAVVPLFANVLLGFILTSMKRQRVLITSNGICFAVNCVLGLFLVQRYGYVGACWATLIAYIALFMANFYFVSSYLTLVRVHSMLLRPLIGTCMAAIFLYAFFDRINIVILSFGGFLIYVGILYILRTFPADELDIFKAALGRVNHRLRA